MNEDVPEKKAKITAEGDFSQPSSKYHSFAEVFLVSLIIIINLIWGEKQDFEIINVPLYSLKFDFRVILLRRIKYLQKPITRSVQLP